MTTTEAATATQVYQLYIKASQEQVWDAITNPEIVAKFFHGARVESTYEVAGSSAVCRPTVATYGATTRFWNVTHRGGLCTRRAQRCGPELAEPDGEQGDMGDRGSAGRAFPAHLGPRPSGPLAQDRGARQGMVLHSQQPQDCPGNRGIAAAGRVIPPVDRRLDLRPVERRGFPASHHPVHFRDYVRLN